MRLLFPAAAGIVLASCGYLGPPLPPLANIPERVTDLAALQRGGHITAHFTVPQLTTEGVQIKRPLDLDLRIGVAPEPFSDEKWAAAAKPVTGGQVVNHIATYEIPSASWTGKDATLGVRAIGANGKEADWSNFVMVPVVPPPPVPAPVKTELTPEGVRLSWPGPEGEFRVLRRAGTEKAFNQEAEVTATSWTDPNTAAGTPYTYIVQRIEKLHGGKEAQSDLSPAVTITPRDIFPPAVPTGLHALPAPASIELSWNANTEPDLAGYRVYRSVDGGPFEKLAELQPVPAYSDHAVEPGKTYRYEVSAFDRTGNESARSAPVEAGLQ